MKNLHKEFVQLGRQKNKIQYRLLQLLPQIYEEGINKKYCRTIEGYAWRFAQISKAVVEKTLKLERHLENKPCLKAIVAEVGINKVAMVASLATSETDSIFAEKIKNMSRDAVQELSKELRSNNWKNDNVNQQSFLENLDVHFNCQAKANTMKIELNEEMTFLFLKFKQKLEKENKQEISNREVMKSLLEMPFKEQKATSPMKGKKISGDFSPSGKICKSKKSSEYQAVMQTAS